MALQLITEKIIVSPDDYTIPAETTRAVQELVASAVEIATVVTPEQNQIAGQVVARIRQTVKDIKAVRVVLSKPLDVAKAKLITMENDATAPLLAEQDRIETLGRQFIESERRRVADEEKKRADEIAQVEAKRRAAEEAVERARQRVEHERQETERKAQEDAAKIKNKAKREAFEKEQMELAKKRAQEEAEAEQERIEQANAAEIKSRAAIVAPLPEVQRTRGQTVKRELRYEVTDIAALYLARPDLCKPVEVKPSAIQATCVPERPVPGLKLWWEETVKYTTR